MGFPPDWAEIDNWAAERYQNDNGALTMRRPKDVNPQLHALGNAVVPQVAEWIGRRILAADAGALP